VKTKEERAACNKIYYIAHKNEISTMKRKYYQENKDKIDVRSRKYHQENKDKVNAQSRKHRDNELLWYHDLLKTKHCENPNCKWIGDWSKDWYILESHHIDPKTKFMGILEMIKKGYSKKEVLKEVNKCIFLCPNCHTIRTLEQKANGEIFKREKSSEKLGIEKGLKKSNLNDIFNNN
jgi:uncharacterized protein YunC (DUF1805 family)